MFKPINNETSRYRMVKNENFGAYNNNTFFTFDHMFSLISKYLIRKTEIYLGRKLKGVEYPDRDTTHQFSQSTDKQLADKTIMPRAIVMYDINPSEDDIVDIPSLKTHFEMNNGITMEMQSIRRHRLDKNVLAHLDHYRDIDVSLYGNMSHTTASIFYTVLMDNKVEAIELQKLFMSDFPLNVIHDVYKTIVRTDDVTGKTDNTKTHTHELELIEYKTKAVIPTEIINNLKEVFDIPLDDPNGDVILKDIIDTYTYEGMRMEVDGSTRKPIWTTKYSVIPILVPTSMVKSNNVKDMSNTSAVRIEFMLSYIEIKAFKLGTKYKVLSPDNPNNIIENIKNRPDMFTGTANLNVLKVSPEIDNCSRLWDLKISYESNDFNSADSTMEVYIPDLIVARDKYFGKYMEYLQNSLVEEDSKLYKIIVKHASNQSIDTDINTSEGTYYSYDTLSIYDTKSEVDQSIYIIAYVDMTEYRKWKVKMGYEDRGNLSGEFIKM